MGHDSVRFKSSHEAPSSSGSSQGPEDTPHALDEKGVQIHNRTDTLATISDSDKEDGKPYVGDPSLNLSKPRTHTLGILKLRAKDDNDPTDWWFASTAIPLIAATFAPMANMLSIAALVVNWRNNVTTPDVPATVYSASIGYADEKWCLYLNAASLACGFIGNLFLLFNFTRRVRYIIALPVTIIFFYFASGILIAIIVCVNKYTPPRENQVYSQGFWHAVIAACLYMLNSMILMANMWGYFLGHYPQNFTLNDEHRNLILQTMLFFIWLAGGAGVFARTEKSESWEYPDALYFCDVTILTIGFGDFYATNDLSRGLVFPYSVGGTIILGLMVSSIHKFAGELSNEKVVRKHVETRRVNTLSRAVTLEELDDNQLKRLTTGQRLSISRPLQRDTDKIEQSLNELAQLEQVKRRTINFQDARKEDYLGEEPTTRATVASGEPSEPTSGPTALQKSFRTLTAPITKPVAMTTDGLRRVMSKTQKRILMTQERDRFNAMRAIQTNASNFHRYYALSISVVCFGMLWCIGAVVFYYAEASTQDLNYFQCLYFCYVSLLTIGYGDLSPKSNAGKAFFVLWSLIAVPTMTILVSDLGDTVIGGFKRGVLQNDLGLTSESTGNSSPSTWRSYLARHFRKRDDNDDDQPSVRSRNPSEVEADRRKPSRIVLDDRGQPVEQPIQTIDELVTEEVSEAEMMRRLAFAIRQTADDLKHHPGKQYSYEEWVQFTRLIRFSNFDKARLRSGEASAMKQLEHDETEDGIVEWDWLDAKSPMTSEQSESEWILDRLCESLLRVFKKSDLVLGGLSFGKGLQQAGVDGATEDGPDHPLFHHYQIDAQEDDDASAASPLDRISDDRPRSPDVIGKMTRFFQGNDIHDGGSQWSRRAKVKMGLPQALETDEPRISQDRRRSSTAAPPRRRHGPFGQ